MKKKLKKLARDLAPPLLLRGLRKLRPRTKSILAGEEKGPDYYDESFENLDDWRRHYSESHYYFLWTVIVDRLQRARASRVLDIGCGPGQLACFIRDKGIPEYRGFDFSPKRVQQAREVCPEYTFTVEDAFKTDLFTSYGYDAVICTEFLEHVERDLEVLDKIAPGVRVLATVPNFPGMAHVRFFRNVDEVRDRYSRSFKSLTVDAFTANPAGKTFFLLEGTR